MGNEKRMDASRLTAIDVHVHLEHEGQGTAADEAAKKYFGEGVREAKRLLATGRVRGLKLHPPLAVLLFFSS